MDNLIQIIHVFNEDELYELNKFIDTNLSFTRSTTFNGSDAKIDVANLPAVEMRLGTGGSVSAMALRTDGGDPGPTPRRGRRRRTDR